MRGTPSDEEIAALEQDYKGMKSYLRRLPPSRPTPLAEILPGAEHEALDVLDKMLAFSPDSQPGPRRRDPLRISQQGTPALMC